MTFEELVPIMAKHGVEFNLTCKRSGYSDTCMQIRMMLMAPIGKIGHAPLETISSTNPAHVFEDAIKKMEEKKWIKPPR